MQYKYTNSITPPYLSVNQFWGAKKVPHDKVTAYDLSENLVLISLAYLYALKHIFIYEINKY